MFYLFRKMREKGSLNLEMALMIGVLVIAAVVSLIFLGGRISNSFLAAGGSVKGVNFAVNGSTGGSGSGGGEESNTTGFGPGGHYTTNSAPEPVDSDWSFISNGDGTWTVEKYIGDVNATEVSIPYSHNGGSVTQIFEGDVWGYSIFHNNDGTSHGAENISKVYIPDTIKTIKDFAFYSTALTSIFIPDSVTSIGESIFEECTNLTSVTLSKNLTTIPPLAFYDCTSLTSINIPDSVTEIGDGAFTHCALTSINIPNGVTKISAEAFFGCASLTSINIPNTVKTIEWSAFIDCTNLTSINIPNGVLNIGPGAFEGCTNLTVSRPAAKTDWTASYLGCKAVTTY